MGMPSEVNYGEYAEKATPTVEAKKPDIEVVKTRNTVPADKDKLILVIYVNVSRIDPADVPEFLSESVGDFFRDVFDDSVKTLVIPVYDEETHVEAVNPKYLSQEEMDKFSEVIEKAEKLIEEFKNEKE